jgi:hypothetical protein
MEIALSGLYFCLFIWIIHRMKFFSMQEISPRGLSLIFGLKVMAGIALWWVYTYYYTDRSTADIYKYFDDSKVMYGALYTHPTDFLKMLFGIGNNTSHFDVYYSQMHNWARQYESNLYNDSHTIIRFNALLRFFSFGFYQVHAVFLCFLSLLGLTAIYKTFIPFLSGKEKLAVISVFLFPSVLFWASGVLKEGILFFGMGLLIHSWFKLWFDRFSFLQVIIILLATLLLLATKFYILVSLTPGLIYIAWIGISGRKKTTVKFAVVMLIYCGLGLSVKWLFPAYDPLQVLAIKQQDFISLAQGGALLRTDTAIVFLNNEQRRNNLIEIPNTKTYQIQPGTPFCYWHDYNADADTLFGKQSDKATVFSMEQDMPRSGSLIPIRILKPTIPSFLQCLPGAIVNSFFRPLPFEARGILLIPSTLEIIFYSIFILFCLIYRKKKEIPTELILFCLSFVVILYTITGMTTPVLGALVRYKVPGIPFLLLAFLFLLDLEKLKGSIIRETKEKTH